MTLNSAIGFAFCRRMMPLLAVLLSLSSTSPAIVVDATVGFSGFYVPGQWTPVTITVENMPRADKAREKLLPFDGACEVRSEKTMVDTSRFVFARELQVPVNDRKRITIYIKLSAGAHSEASVYFDSRLEPGCSRRPT